MKKLHIETYGCQMNIADSEVVASILSPYYEITDSLREANLILLNTCSVRDHAEQRIRKRLRELVSLKKKNKNLHIGLLGCMAERIKEQLLEEEKGLDFIAGPDAYRTLPQLIKEASLGNLSFNVQLSETETYDNIAPVRYASNGVSAFLAIMRGCNNFCSYCVVPYTRGRERSRNPKTILDESQILFNKGFREVTLLGQNVNSYHWTENLSSVDFADLTERIAQISPLLRIRYATSHPKDISDKLLYIMAKYPNVCPYIHLPVQSGSNEVLKKMNRVYTREYYLERIRKIKEILPDCAISTDLIAGFCGETEQDHQDTLSLMKEVGFEYAFMFKYSVREGTKAAEKFEDNIPEELKIKRLDEIIALQQKLSLESNKRDIGKTFTVLVEGISKRSDQHFFGRNLQNKVCVFPRKNHKIGDDVSIKITKCTSGTLIGEQIENKVLRFKVLSLVFALLLFCSSAFAQSSPIVILHTNDTHSQLESYIDKDFGNVGGVVRRYTFIQETRNQYPGTIVVDAGDFSQGTPYYNMFKGVPEIEWMNTMGYDVVALGNHEFDNGSKHLAKRLKLADFKIVCANYKFKNKQLAKLVKPYTIMVAGNKKIGFFGLLCDMKRVVMPDYYQETTFLDPVSTAQKIVEILKNKEQCDIIICLSHLGFEAEFAGDISDKDLAEKVSGIDFIIGGHTHKLLEEPVIVNDTKILQARKSGSFVGRIMIGD